LTIEHENGVVGNLISVFNGVVHREERRLEVFLEQATVELTTDFVVGAKEDSLLIHRADEEEAVVYNVDALRRATFAADGFDPQREVFVYQYFAHHAFATAIAAATPPSPNVDDALQAHAIVEAAYQSAATKQPVDLANVLAK
jgi:predicted dehydrogenase